MYAKCITFVVILHICNHNIHPYQLLWKLFDTPQLLKQVAEYKSQLNGLKEQETDMRDQVGWQVITDNIGFLSFTFRTCFLYNVVFIISPQLDMYSKKFDEFQGTVSKSNSVYSSFKQDMDKVRMAF